jgi:hypothetical protein
VFIPRIVIPGDDWANLYINFVKFNRDTFICASGFKFMYYNFRFLLMTDTEVLSDNYLLFLSNIAWKKNEVICLDTFFDFFVCSLGHNTVYTLY